MLMDIMSEASQSHSVHRSTSNTLQEEQGATLFGGACWDDGGTPGGAAGKKEEERTLILIEDVDLVDDDVDRGLFLGEIKCWWKRMVFFENTLM